MSSEKAHKNDTGTVGEILSCACAQDRVIEGLELKAGEAAAEVAQLATAPLRGRAPARRGNFATSPTLTHSKVLDKHITSRLHAAHPPIGSVVGAHHSCRGLLGTGACRYASLHADGSSA